VYNYNTNNNNNGDNNQNSGTIHQNKGDLSGGTIAGITVACTVVGTILAAMGVWYARQQARTASKENEADVNGR